MKPCTKCNDLKDESEFTKDSRYKSGLSSYCRSCRREYRERYLSNPKNRDRIRVKKREKNTGWNATNFELAWIRQCGKCEICNRTIKKEGRGKGCANADHCHLTGKLRGLLCNSCNVAIGLMKDNPSILRSAAKYLESYDNYAPDEPVLHHTI